MGIRGLSAKRDLHIVQDPFKLLTTELRICERKKSLCTADFFAGILIIAFAVVVVFVCLRESGLLIPRGDVPYVLLELRTLDQGSHPVVGASVFYNGEQIGTTDAFGEWRKFMQVPFGTNLFLKVKKETSRAVYETEKELTVPTNFAENGEIRISSTIQLLRAKKI